MTLGRRGRWRAASAAGLTAAVAVGVLTSPAVPVHAAESSAGYTVTVQPPGPGSPAGEIASGTVNGQGWQIAYQHCPDSSGSCFNFTGAALDGDSESTNLAGLEAVAVDNPAAPVALFPEQPAQGGTQLQCGPVKADVALVKVSLTNGAVLTLHPVKVAGFRVVGFAAPGGATIVSATAYASGGGAIGTADPFGQPGLASIFGIWLKPGQHGLPRASGVIGSGHGWTARGYVGPYGLCFSYNNGDSCTLVAPKRGAFDAYEVTTATPAVDMGLAAPGVIRIVFKLPGGKTELARLVTIGGQKFYSVILPPNDVNPDYSWIAYYANGTKVPGG